jgi:hypothetical protein
MKIIFSILILLSISFKANSLSIDSKFCAGIEGIIVGGTQNYVTVDDYYIKEFLSEKPDEVKMKDYQEFKEEIIERLERYSSVYKNLCKN